MFTVLAMIVLVATFVVMVMNLRVVARDTYDALQAAVTNTINAGRLVPAAAFGGLWITVFFLSLG